jgi:site-specific DNA-methyltransferase (adenine-specific)
MPVPGSGSTLAAAEAMGYESVGVEMDAKYIAVARKAISRLAAMGISERCLSYPIAEDAA